VRLAVFLPNWVGDVVMATPALRSLRRYVDAGELIGVMRPYVAEVLAGGDWFDSQIVYDKQQRDPVERLRAAKIDTAVLLTNSLRTAWMAYRGGARERVGMVGNFRSWLLTTRVYPMRRGRKCVYLPTVASYLLKAQAAGAPPVAPKLEIATTDEDERRADAVWRRLGWQPSMRVAVFNTGGAFGAAKDWPAEHFAELARRLAARKWNVLVNCGPNERETARAIATATSHSRVRSLADEAELPIGLTKAVIRRAAVLITTDSGPRFFGVALGVPTVSLFGPTSPKMTQTFSPYETTVTLGLDCQPCLKRKCPLGHHRCMRDLTVERVEAAIVAALRKVQREAA
jgi:heptosyltransferase-2